MKKIILLSLLILLITSCTDNVKARTFGGVEEIALPKDNIVIGATWKGADLWILLKDTTTNRVVLQEYSSYGVLNGSVKFNSQ